MLDSIYHMTFKSFVIVFWCVNVKILPNICDVVMGVSS